MPSFAERVFDGLADLQRGAQHAGAGADQQGAIVGIEAARKRHEAPEPSALGNGCDPQTGDPPLALGVIQICSPNGSNDDGTLRGGGQPSARKCKPEYSFGIQDAAPVKPRWNGETDLRRLGCHLNERTHAPL